LRRPFSIHDVKKDTISFLYRVVGKGTKLLSEIKSEMLPLLGPLGKGYDLTPDSKGSIGAGKKICFNPIIVAGGTGIASVYFLAAKLKKKGVLYYGVRTKKDLLCLDKFKKIDWKIVVSTDDGSKGYKGYITDLISKNLKNSDMLFACGPIPMLKKVLHVAKEKNIKGFISLEEKMACGIGNCQGCAVKIKGEYKMVCKDGPVFKIEELEL
jgi:dihydroorotate dehydrogenase electron transfer subunit